LVAGAAGVTAGWLSSESEPSEPELYWILSIVREFKNFQIVKSRMSESVIIDESASLEALNTLSFCRCCKFAALLSW
jgi:hypothetical protein